MEFSSGFFPEKPEQPAGNLCDHILSGKIFHNLFTRTHRTFLSHDRTPDRSHEPEEAFFSSGCLSAGCCDGDVGGVRIGGI